MLPHQLSWWNLCSFGYLLWQFYDFQAPAPAMVPGRPFWNIAASPPWPWRPLSVREQALPPSLLSLSVAYLRFWGHLVVLKTPVKISTTIYFVYKSLPFLFFSLSIKCSPFHQCRRLQFFCGVHTEVLPQSPPTSYNCSLSPPLSQFEQCLLESGNHGKDHS